MGNYWAILAFFLVLGVGTACTRHSQDVEPIETSTMAADVNDSVTKTLTLTSGADQMLVSVNFPLRANNYFSVSEIDINGTALPKGTDFNNINQAIKKDDVITIKIVYAPTTLPDPGDELVRHHVLNVILEGPKVVNVEFHLYGVSYGVCESCKATIPATAREKHFKVNSLEIHISDVDASPTESNVEGTTKNEFVFYFDTASGKAFLKGEDIPQFAISTPSGTASASGKEGEIFEGTYTEDSDGDHFTIYEVHISAPSASSPNLYTDLTTESIRVSDKEGSSYLDGVHDDMYEKYYDFGNVDGKFDGKGVPYKDRQLTMVGGVILPDVEVLQDLEGAVLGLTFELSDPH